MLDIVLVAAGGFIGANARFLAANLFARRFGTTFPYGTLFINASGSFILGLFLSLASHSILSEDTYRWLIAVGFCGGYTTFSTFTYETLTLLREGRLVPGWLSNALGSYVLSLSGALIGSIIGGWLA